MPCTPVVRVHSFPHQTLAFTPPSPACRPPAETSLSRLFYEAKLTGVLPVPEAVAEGSHEGAGGGSSACQGGRSRASSQEGSGPGSGASCADSGGAGGTPALAENVRQTRAAARRSGHAGGGAAGSLPPPPPQQQQEIAGTKRRKAGGGS